MIVPLPVAVGVPLAVDAAEVVFTGLSGASRAVESAEKAAERSIYLRERNLSVSVREEEARREEEPYVAPIPVDKSCCSMSVSCAESPGLVVPTA